MTLYGQESEFEILGCRIKYTPDSSDRHVANVVIKEVMDEIDQLKKQRPNLKDTDVAVLVALKMAKEKRLLENEYKDTVLELESSLRLALTTMDEN